MNSDRKVYRESSSWRVRLKQKTIKEASNSNQTKYKFYSSRAVPITNTERGGKYETIAEIDQVKQRDQVNSKVVQISMSIQIREEEKRKCVQDGGEAAYTKDRQGGRPSRKDKE